MFGHRGAHRGAHRSRSQPIRRARSRRYGIVCGPCGRTHSVAAGPAARIASDDRGGHIVDRLEVRGADRVRREAAGLDQHRRLHLHLRLDLHLPLVGP